VVAAVAGQQPGAIIGQDLLGRIYNLLSLTGVSLGGVIGRMFLPKVITVRFSVSGRRLWLLSSKSIGFGSAVRF